MGFLTTITSAISDFLSMVYSALTTFFVDIRLDESLSFFCEYSLLICFLIFIAMLPYFIFFDKNRTYMNYVDPKNLVIMLCLLGLYYFLADKSVNLSEVGLGTITINPFLLMVVAKLYGAIPTAVFGAAEYFIYATFVNHDDPLMFALFFIYAIGGLIHGYLLYNHKTAFWRCLVTRIITVILCNIFLISFVRAGTYTNIEVLSTFIPQTITSNILQVPVQAIVGYISLRLIKLLKANFEF